MSKQKIGICVTTFNDEEHIEKNIKSYLLQETPLPIKVYVLDDGSTDGTCKKLKKITKLNKNLKIKICPNRERGVARTECIEMAIKDECEYILFVDSDMRLKFNLVRECMKIMTASSYSCLVIPEVPFSTHKNFMTKVKIFERKLMNDIGESIEKNSIEAARFWRTTEYIRSGGLNPNQISFEETQPTLRIIEKNGKLKRVTSTCLFHDEGHVTLVNLIKKKSYYFKKMKTTTTQEKNGFLKTLQRWYFFRSYMYTKKSIKKFLIEPQNFCGVIFMYICLTAIGVQSGLSWLKKSKF